jgi:hypothetical protein
VHATLGKCSFDRVLCCSYVERFLDCISNGTIPDDSRSAMTELQPLVAESHSAQMSFGAMGLFSSTF